MNFLSPRPKKPPATSVIILSVLFSISRHRFLLVQIYLNTSPNTERKIGFTPNLLSANLVQKR